MGIYRGTAPLKAYKGDMQPVNVYKGSTKVAGWHSASYSGASPLTVDCDYNVPPDALTVDGKCVQTGTPSPDSPAPISTITGDVTITGADGAAIDTVTVAFGSAVCASLLDGTHDSYDAVTGVLTKRVGKMVLTGKEAGWGITPADVYAGYYVYCGEMLNGFKADLVCDKFVSSIFDNGIDTTRRRYRQIHFYPNTQIAAEPPTAEGLTQFKAWLSANPVTVYYPLATPTTVQLTPHLPVVRTGIKTLSVGADVVPTLSATVKSMD